MIYIFHITWGVTVGFHDLHYLLPLLLLSQLLLYLMVLLSFTLATGWFDLSGFYFSCWGNVLDYLPSARRNIYMWGYFFLSKWKLLDILSLHGCNMLCLQKQKRKKNHSGEKWSKWISSSRWPLVQYHLLDWSHHSELQSCSVCSGICCGCPQQTCSVQLTVWRPPCHAVSPSSLSQDALRLSHQCCSVALLAVGHKVSTAERRHYSTFHHDVYSTIFFV